MDAIREFNGANAKGKGARPFISTFQMLMGKSGTGQPIHMTIVSSAPKRNPFDTAQMPGRPLAERITRPRSLSPNNRGVDRYVPNSSRRSHSPRPRRRGGRRTGARRENNGGGDAGGRENGGRNVGRDGRPKKTQEELDAEMEDYFEKSGGNAATDAAAAARTNAANEAQTGAPAPAVDDVDMIE